MKKILFGILVLTFFYAPTINGQVKSDYDKDFDFTTVKSVTFAGWEKNSDKILNDFDKKRILDAFKAEFMSRGIEVKMMDGDVQITVYVVVENKTSTTAYTDYTGGFGYGAGWGWGMGASTTNYVENDYQEGTLVLDMYDVNKKMIWQGVLNTEVKENPEKRDKSIPKNIKKLMKEYPVKPVK